MKPIISEEKLLDILPHGCGIDYDWQITAHKNGNITAKNYYHAMNDAGYYDGRMPFSVRIFRHKKDIFHALKGPCEGKTQVIARKNDIDFSIRCNDSRYTSFYGLRNYLEDTINYSLSENGVITERNEVIEGE